MFANRFWSAQRKARQGARRRGSASEAGDCCLLRRPAGRKAEAGGYTRVQGSHTASSISLPAKDRSLPCPISPAFHLENETENTPRTRVPDPRLRRPAMPTARGDVAAAPQLVHCPCPTNSKPEPRKDVSEDGVAAARCSSVEVSSGDTAE